MKKMKTVFGLIFTLLAVGGFTQENIVATKAAFIKGITDSEENANAYGVYPVAVSWDNNKEVDYYTVMRFDEDENLWQMCDTISANKDTLDATNNRITFIDKNSNATPNKVYRYKVSGINRVKGTVRVSGEAEGYGALTALCYMDTYNLSVLASHNKLTLMHKKFALQKLGKETIRGDMCGGVSYHAKVRGFGGFVVLQYNEYEEYPGWLLNGNTNIKANIWANGKMLEKVNCRGMYPGSVDYSNIKIKKGKAKGGYYTIAREGFPNETIVWDAIQTEINHVYSECEDKPAPDYADVPPSPQQLATFED